MLTPSPCAGIDIVEMAQHVTHRMSAYVRSLAGPVLAFGVPVIVVTVLVARPELDPELGSIESGFLALWATALLSAVCAIIVGISGIRLRSIQILCLSAAFVTPPFMLALHDPSLSGRFFSPAGTLFRTIGPAATLSIVASAFWLFVSSLPPDTPVVRNLARTPYWVLPIWVLILVALNVVSLTGPAVIDPVPATPGRVYDALSIGVLVLLSAAWRNYWRSWRYSRFPLERSILYSISLLLAAQIAGGLTGPWHVSWWTLHIVLLASVISVFTGLILQFRGSAGLGTIFSGEMYGKLVYGISPSVRALVLATEARDRYTGGHNLRVALFALRLAQELNLSPEQRRAVAHGGVIHDVGKIALPDSILNKPSRLTDEEFAEVKRHPVTGHGIGTHLGMGGQELDVIRHHHERFDGAGYPDRRAGREIPLIARVVAVADVFDALTSTRSYRAAWSPERAAAVIRENAGTQFDPECVAAWQNIPTSDLQQIAAVSGFTRE